MGQRVGEQETFLRHHAHRAAQRVEVEPAHASCQPGIGENIAFARPGATQDDVRAAIARAILKNPELIILDEATSALDSACEHLVQQGLNRLVAGRTSVVIAHRVSTVMNADHILVLQNSVVREQGRHDELAGRGGGLYAHLFALQTKRGCRRWRGDSLRSG